MRELSSSKMDDSLLIQIWKQRLPQAIQEILSGSADNTPSTELARIADRIRDVETQRTVNVVQSQQPAGVNETLVAAVQLLTKKIEQLQTRGRDFRSSSMSSRNRQHRQRSGSNSNAAPNRANTPARTAARANNDESRMCWYHRCFGADAENCTQPCSFQRPAANNQPN